MMPGSPQSPGRIVSFYSFKGGVGRTMALANVAFLAAMNDLRVLVMDWDLEAPGLHHYFRGQLDPEEMAKLRSAPGVLDLAWKWRNGIEQATNPEEIDRQFELFRSGEPFEALVRRVIVPDDFGDGGCLDIIPAGGTEVETPELVEYERALAAMSWNELLDRYAGGGLIDSLRHWSSNKYDLVLVDSRTGLADVSGICTMQLPDAVVLSFVLNRQNIDGVARVASAIRRYRGDAVKIWSVPMRVSREGTDEEADATARALRELTRPGRLDREATERDLKNLLIKAEPNVPFMESLSAFNVTNAALDPLTANMARLASEITGRAIIIPDINEHWRDVVSSRLAPALSTDAYLRQLLTAEPGRAGRALHRYVESAISTLVEGEELADDYIAALAETALAFEQRIAPHLRTERYDTTIRLIALLRKVYERDPKTWRHLLVAALESALDSDLDWLGVEDQALALGEIDELLAIEQQDAATVKRRVEMRIRAARLYGEIDEPLEQLGTADEALGLLKSLRNLPDDLPDGAAGGLRALRLEALLLRAAAQEQLDQLDEAIGTLREVIDSVVEFEHSEGSSDAQRFGFEGNYRLMRLLRDTGGDRSEISLLALEATRRASQNALPFIARLADLADAVLAVKPNAQAAAELLTYAVAPPFTSRAYAGLFSRAPASGVRVTNALSELLKASVSGIPPNELTTLAWLAADVIREGTIACAERALSVPQRSIAGNPRHPTSILATQVQASLDFVNMARTVVNTTEASTMLDELAQTVIDIGHQIPEATPGRRVAKPPRSKLR